MKTIRNVTQSIDDFDPKYLKSIKAALYSEPGKNAAFREWLGTLDRNDKLPRGSFFRDKKPLPRIIFDESWQALGEQA